MSPARALGLAAVLVGACREEWHFSTDAGGGCPARGCPAPLVCAAALARCAECSDDVHCPASRRHCDVPRGACVECLAHADCPPSAVCEAEETRTCVPTCSFDAGCAVGRCTQLALGPVCDACFQEDICEHMQVLRHCDPARRGCVRCSEDRHCAAPLSRCDRRSGACVECIDSRDCSGALFCIAGTCRTS